HVHFTFIDPSTPQYQYYHAYKIAKVQVRFDRERADDVLQAFEIQEAVRFQCDGKIITYMRDGNGNWYNPKRLPCHPGLVIEVVCKAPQSGSTSLSSIAAPGTVSNEKFPPGEYHKYVAATEGFERMVVHKLDGLHDQGVKTQQLAYEIWKLQKQMNDRLILIQNKTEAILTQQLELAEYPIPRLFIVLPEEPSQYDPGSWFRTKFRLHFICECGHHTEPKGNKVPHHLHLAKHEGYLIREPTEFFKKYGPFLLLMLELIKFGTAVAGHVVPALAALQAVELVDSVRQSVEVVAAKIDYSLQCIDKQLAKVQESSPRDLTDSEPREAMTEHDLTNYLSDVEGLEGVELRQLGSFLKTSEDDNLLGNLYRMTTADGHVKWVCYDHYRASYQENHTQKLRDVISLAQGEFDEQRGKIEITLSSSFIANEFYNAIRKAKGVVELVVYLNWECKSSDLEELQEALKNSRISIVWLSVRQFRSSLGGKLLSASTRHVFSRIMDHPNMKMIHIVLPKELLKLSTFQLKRPSHIRQLSLEALSGSIGEKELGALSATLRTNSPLTDLSLSNNTIKASGVRELSESLKTNSTLIALDLSSNLIGDDGAQVLSNSIKINSTLTTLNLENNAIGSEGSLALSKALKVNSTLTVLSLDNNTVGDNGALALSEALKSNSTLTALNLERNFIEDSGALALSEALQTNSTLTILFLGNNSIWFEGALALVLAFSANSTLSSLDLQGNRIGERLVQALSDAFMTISTQASLHLIKSSIGLNGILALSSAIKTNLTVSTLNLHGSAIGDSGAQTLSEALKANSTLTTLDLENNLIEFEGAQALSAMLKINATLKNLSLRDNSIGDFGANALYRALKANPSLLTLDLHGNSIGDVGAHALSKAFKTNSSLVTLDLGSNAIRFDGILALILACNTNSTLSNLVSKGNKIEESCAEELLNLFKKNSSETLSSHGDTIGECRALALIEVIKTNSILTHLNLNGAAIGNSGARALSVLLRTNSTLRALNLENNTIRCNGVQALSEALEENSSLIALNLTFNLIRDVGAEALADALERNSTLTSLHLEGNSVGNNGAQALSEALRVNSTLTTLNLKDNVIGNIGAEALTEVLKINSTLATCTWS
ncbi:hypothetical protein BGZ72_008224, partial [Mortierella alpina]